MDKINLVESEYLKKDIFNFNVGDTVKVYVKIAEGGEKTRAQIFEGVVIRKRGSGISTSFTVRKISYGEGIEKTFPIHSPAVEKIKVVKKGKVRRAKLYYLRGKIGKRTKLEDREDKKEIPASAVSSEAEK